jgi:hypothetical protein
LEGKNENGQGIQTSPSVSFRILEDLFPQFHIRIIQASPTPGFAGAYGSGPGIRKVDQDLSGTY